MQHSSWLLYCVSTALSQAQTPDYPERYGFNTLSNHAQLLSFVRRSLAFVQVGTGRYIIQEGTFPMNVDTGSEEGSLSNMTAAKLNIGRFPKIGTDKMTKGP